MSCIHNWSPRLSLYLKKKKRQVTIWRDSSAATMKRRSPSLPSNSIPCGSWDGLQSAFQSTRSQLGSVGNRGKPQGDSFFEAGFWKGKRGFLRGRIYHNNLILWKSKRPGDIIFCLCRCMKVFSPKKKTTPVPFSFQSDSLTKCRRLSENFPRRVCHQVPFVMCLCLVCEGFLCDTDCSHLL